jgi:hypothetical protein
LSIKQRKPPLKYPPTPSVTALSWVTLYIPESDVMCTRLTPCSIFTINLSISAHHGTVCYTSAGSRQLDMFSSERWITNDRFGRIDRYSTKYKENIKSRWFKARAWGIRLHLFNSTAKIISLICRYHMVSSPFQGSLLIRKVFIYRNLTGAIAPYNALIGSSCRGCQPTYYVQATGHRSQEQQTWTCTSICRTYCATEETERMRK